MTAWMRWIMPWWLLELIVKIVPDLCWCEIVMWKQYGDHSWRATRMCHDGGTDNWLCYCGLSDAYKENAKR